LRLIFLPAAAIALIAQFAIVRSVLAGRAPASSPGRGARLAEIAWVVLPAIALIGVLYMTWTSLGEPVALAPVNGITV
jgi:heme/copper-type cytochrome/quinol oxidase subunit 2